MSDGYKVPYESLHSTAKLIRLPKNGHKTGSASRSFWARIFSPNNSLSSMSSSSIRPKKNVFSSPTSVGSQDSNSTALAHNDTATTHAFHASSPKNSSVHFSPNMPTPRPRTSISRNSVSESITSTKETNFASHSPKLGSSPKTRTTVTVHLSKTSKTRSNPDLVSTDHEPERSCNFNNRKTFCESQKWPSSNNHWKSEANMNLTEDDRSKSMSDFIDERPSLRTESTNNLELNSLQVFRQEKYRNRIKAERRIKQLEHLKQNEKCDAVVKQLSQGMHPNTYENQQNLKLVEFVNEDGFITSSRASTPVLRFSANKAQLPTPPRRNPGREHIYAEIEELDLKNLPVNGTIKTPVLRKKVTFSTFHVPIQEAEPISQNKKILPAKFWGIVQVIEALRSRTDEERRRIAKLCYHAVLTGADDHSLQFLGKVDNSRWGENVYVVLQERNFEIRDNDGLIVAKHRFSDISVVTQVEDDPCVFVYVGRCKFNGRIGLTLRFTKSKHVSLLLESFKNYNR